MKAFFECACFAKNPQVCSLVLLAANLRAGTGVVQTTGGATGRERENLRSRGARFAFGRSTVIDLGGRTLLPGMIDLHVHLFLHPGAEDLQTVEESVPARVIIATPGEGG